MIPRSTRMMGRDEGLLYVLKCAIGPYVANMRGWFLKRRGALIFADKAWERRREGGRFLSSHGRRSFLPLAGALSSPPPQLGRRGHEVQRLSLLTPPPDLKSALLCCPRAGFFQGFRGLGALRH